MARAKRPYLRISQVGSAQLISIIGTPQSDKLVRASQLIPADAPRAFRAQVLHDFLMEHVRYTERQAAYLRKQAPTEIE